MLLLNEWVVAAAVLQTPRFSLQEGGWVCLLTSFAVQLISCHYFDKWIVSVTQSCSCSSRLAARSELICSGQKELGNRGDKQ
jgi:hypothetical protein